MLPAADERSRESDVEVHRREAAAPRRRFGQLDDLIRPLLRFVWRHPFVSAEALLGLFALWRLTDPVFRAAVGDTLTFVAINFFSSARSTWALLQVDTRGTLESLARTAGTLLVALLPLLALARRLRGWQRLHFAWLPILYFLWPLVGTASPALLAVVSAVTLWLIRFRWLRWTAVLPLASMCASVPIHQFGVVWSSTAMAERCARNDGRRPSNLQAEQIHPGYVGVSQLRPGEVLLPAAGGRGSRWLRRVGGDWQFEAPSQVNFPFWTGCLIGDDLWLARPSFMMAVRRDAATGEESVRTFPLPEVVMDVGDVVCLPEEGRVLVTEALSGSAIWEANARTGEVRRWKQEVGGIGSMARRGPGDRLVAGAGSDLVVYSLAREEEVERTPAGVQMFGGIDVCPLDGEAALADLAGRLRFFKLDARGHYRFEWGLPLRAPRAVAYSPGCQHVAVTSWDDESVYLIDRASQRHVATYRVGPALRGITFFGPRELAIVDVCTMSVVTF
jgi:hypothetical protein